MISISIFVIIAITAPFFNANNNSKFLFGKVSFIPENHYSG